MILSFPARTPVARGADAAATVMRRERRSEAQIETVRHVVTEVAGAALDSGCRSYLLGVREAGQGVVLIQVTVRKPGWAPAIGDLPPGCTSGVTSAEVTTTAWVTVPPLPTRYDGGNNARHQRGEDALTSAYH